MDWQKWTAGLALLAALAALALAVLLGLAALALAVLLGLAALAALGGAGGLGAPVVGVDLGPSVVALVRLLGHGKDVAETPPGPKHRGVGRLVLPGPPGLRGFAAGTLSGAATAEGVLQALDASGTRRSRAALGLVGLAPEPSQVPLTPDLGFGPPPHDETRVLVLLPHLDLPQRRGVETTEGAKLAVHDGECLGVHSVLAPLEFATAGLGLAVLEGLLTRQDGAPGGLCRLVPLLGGTHGVALGLLLVPEAAERDQISSLEDRARVALGLGELRFVVEAGLAEPVNKPDPDPLLLVPPFGHPSTADFPNGVAVGVAALRADPRRLLLGLRLARRHCLLGRRHGADDEVLVVLVGQGACRHRDDARRFRHA
jgi:hypothetical protein